MASITVAQLASLEEYGVIGRRKGGNDLYTEDTVEIAAAAGGSAPRRDRRPPPARLADVRRARGRALRAARDAAAAPAQSRRRGSQVAAQLDELNALGAKLRSALLRAAVHEQLDL